MRRKEPKNDCGRFGGRNNSGDSGLFLVNRKESTCRGASVGQWYVLDYTEIVSPTQEGAVKVTHTSWTEEGENIVLGSEVNWSGAVKWDGLSNENLSTYNLKYLKPI